MIARRKHPVISKLLLLLAAAFICGCEDNNRKCPQGLNVTFFSKSPCQSQPVYPEEINDMLLCVFDGDDLLVYHRRSENIAFGAGYTETVMLPGGLYSVTAWSGINSGIFDIAELKDGETLKSDLLFRLRREAALAYHVEGVKIYTGESRAVYIPKGDYTGDVFESVRVNMQEVTNRITVTVEGLQQEMEDYEVIIKSENGSMNIDGTIADDEAIEYEASAFYGPELLEADFTTLKLRTGTNGSLIVRNRVSGAELYRGSLLGTLILKNPEVNLDCDHDFVIRFTAEDQCRCGTYTITEIWVNDWLVHSYDASME